MIAFALASFLGAFLIFEVQPFIGKAILPWFGGTPSVWSTCMLFFQTLLLGGYCYAHLLATRLSFRRQVVVHGLLLAGALGLLTWQWLAWGGPVLPGEELRPTDSENPVGRLLLLLATTVGLPYFILSATGPLVQAWFNRACPDRSPYRLYVLSNIGSLLALVSYPFVIEPLLKLRLQAGSWAILYGLFALVMLWCGRLLLRRASAGSERPATEPVGGEAEGLSMPTVGDRLLWLALPACASAMLLAATNQICQEVAVIPFLWVLPLVLYLLSFIIVFAGDSWYSRKWWGIIFLVMTGLACGALYEGFSLSITGQVAVYSGLLLALCMVCHGEMVRLRPHPSRLTSFYLTMSAGGALGGALVSLGAPLLFHGFWELHVSLWVGWALFLAVIMRQRVEWATQPGIFALRKALLGLLLVLAGVLWGHTRQANGDAIFCDRNFYGVLRVRQMRWSDPTYQALKLSHGAIVHGFQRVAPAWRNAPASYYGGDSGISMALAFYPVWLEEALGRKQLRVGVVGLGVGTLASFGRAGDYYRFYEINPAVTALTQGDEPVFTYLKDSPAEIEIVDGDARISMERELAGGGSGNFDVLAIDAFSSDSIPAHLLTREAIQLYMRHLRPEGILALHISNRHLDLRPVVTAIAAQEGLEAWIIEADGNGEEFWSNTWVLVTANLDFLEEQVLPESRSNAKIKHGTDVWTDDYSNVYQILR